MLILLANCVFRYRASGVTIASRELIIVVGKIIVLKTWNLCRLACVDVRLYMCERHFYEWVCLYVCMFICVLASGGKNRFKIFPFSMRRPIQISNTQRKRVFITENGIKGILEKPLNSIKIMAL